VWFYIIIVVLNFFISNCTILISNPSYVTDAFYIRFRGKKGGRRFLAYTYDQEEEADRKSKIGKPERAGDQKSKIDDKAFNSRKMKVETSVESSPFSLPIWIHRRRSCIICSLFYFFKF
jgi:hypothetical protein